MAIDIGPTLKRRRQWARLTQQELVDHTRMERSSSYISAIESGKTSPTLAEVEQLARYFRVGTLEFLEEAAGESGRKSAGSEPAPLLDDRLERSYAALSESDQELVLEFVELLAKRGKR